MQPASTGPICCSGKGYYGRQSYGESDLLGLEVARRGDRRRRRMSPTSDREEAGDGDRWRRRLHHAEFARVDTRHGGALFQRISNTSGAAAVMESFVTAWKPLCILAVRPWASVLIHAAAGGVGSACVAIAHALGARVFATANAERRIDVLALGAEAVFGLGPKTSSRACASAPAAPGRCDRRFRRRRLSCAQFAQPRAGWASRSGRPAGRSDSANSAFGPAAQSSAPDRHGDESRQPDEKRAGARFAESALPMFADGRPEAAGRQVFLSHRPPRRAWRDGEGVSWGRSC